MRWLITGGEGMLAREFARLLPPDDVLAPGRSQLDITDESAVASMAQGVDVVVNTAAWTAVDAAESAEDAAHAVNALGAERVARAARSAGARLVQISTDYVFDGAPGRPFAEDAIVNPTTAYGRSKAEGEARSVRAHPDGTTIVRTSWLYGRYGRCFPRSIAAGLAERGAVDVVDDQHGQPTWARDVARSVIDLMGAGVSVGTFHATGGGQATWFEFAARVATSLGYPDDAVRPIATDSAARAAPRPRWSVLAHGTWGDAGLAAPRPWRDMLDDALPDLALTSATVRNGTP